MGKERDLELVPAIDETDRAVANYQFRMDLAAHPGLVQQHLNRMNEEHHDMYRQIMAIAHQRSDGDVSKKRALMEMAAITDMIHERKREDYSIESDRTNVITLPVREESPGKPERRFRLFKGRGTAATIGAAIFTLAVFRRPNTPNGGDAA